MDIKELRSLRESKNWTRKNLADKLAVSVSTVQSWEQGTKIPRPVTIQAIERLFKNSEKYKTINTFYGIVLNMKPNIKIAMLYTNQEELNNFMENISALEKGDNLNGYSIITIKTTDIIPKELFFNNCEIKFSQIKDVEVTRVFGKGLSIKDIKSCQLRVNLDETRIEF